MIQRLSNSRKRDEGFTLIELLIVIIILGILAAIVVFAIGSTRKDSVSSACKTDLKSIELSLESVNTKTGSYPSSQSGAVSPNSGALLKSWPTSSDYAFALGGGGATYDITVTGPNVDGGHYLNDSPSSQVGVVCKGK